MLRCPEDEFCWKLGLVSSEISIYLHWPFCKAKCPYCDFNSHVRNGINDTEYSNSYIKEIEYYRHILETRVIKSIFFGGGTPSTAPLQFFEDTINALNKITKFKENIEITIEANPTSIEVEKFKNLAAIGINRASIGIQSFNDQNLKFLGREHSAEEAIKALSVAAKYFAQYSFDLIYALPEQTLQEWISELKEALQYSKDHLSLYQLTIEKGTPFFQDYKQQKFILPNEQLACLMYEATQEILEDASMPQYEISNHARLGKESIHNLNYWEYGDYLGIGAGAHGRYQWNGVKYATVNYHLPDKWLNCLQNSAHALQKKEVLSSTIQWQERVMMGLRMRHGINATLLDGEIVQELMQQNYLIKKDKKIQVTSSGRLVLNSIITRLLTSLPDSEYL